MVDRLEPVESQQFCQLQRVHSIAAAALYPVVLWVTDHHSFHQWFYNLVEPGGVVTLFESEMYFSPQVPEEISHCFRRRLDHRACYKFAVRIENGNRDSSACGHLIQRSTFA